MAQDKADEGRQAHGERLLMAACALLFLFVYAIFIARTTFRDGGRLVGTLFDDALISLRYAQNLAAGHGLVWNPGEQPPVEGYTNLAWTLVMSAIARVFPFQIAPIAVAAVGAVMLIASGLVAWAVLRSVGSGARTRVGGMLLVLACYPTMFWALRGMEVGLLSLLLLAAIYLATGDVDSRHSARALALVSIVGGLGALTRNDSVLLFAIVLAFAVWRRGIAGHLAAAIGPIAACVFLQLAFRYSYYHELVPNTYVLKMTGVPLTVRLIAGLKALANSLAPIVCAATVAALVASSTTTPRRIRELCGLVIALLVIQWAYLVWVGGDAWSMNYSNRFVATVTPALLVATAAALPYLEDAFRRSARRAAVFVVVNGLILLWLGVRRPLDIGPHSNWTILAGWLMLLGLAVVARSATLHLSARRASLIGLLAVFLMSSAHGWVSWIPANAPKVDDDVAFAKQGLMLRERMPPDSVIAAGWLGAPAYFSGLASIDLLGKTDKRIARLPGTLPFRPGHNKMDLAYSVGERRPDLVLDDDPAVAQFGYVRLPNGLWMRVDSPIVNQRASVSGSWCASPSESVYCPQDPPAHP